jgi:hypothetical protein
VPPIAAFRGARSCDGPAMASLGMASLGMASLGMAGLGMAGLGECLRGAGRQPRAAPRAVLAPAPKDPIKCVPSRSGLPSLRPGEVRCGLTLA